MWVGMHRRFSTFVNPVYPDVRLSQNINGFLNRIYPLASCAFQPSYGKVYTLFSSKIVFLVALLIFEIGSVVCATAANSHVFILGRALAGLGSAGIQAGTTLILADCVPLRRRPTWNSIIGSMFAVGSVVGPLLVFTYFFSVEKFVTVIDTRSREEPSQIQLHGVGVSIPISQSEALS